MSNIIFHIDVNSAFLSWSAVARLAGGDTLDLRTVPSIIGGDLASRHGIVLAKSVPAKAYDIHTAEPLTQAIRKCPGLIVEPPNHALYTEYSKKMMALLHTYTSDIEQLSVDECYLDYTPIARLYESPLAAAQIISSDIKNQLGFTVNIGIAPNKLLAKMASDFEKPDRIHTLFPEEIPAKMWPLPVDDLYMVGRSSATRLKSLGIRTIGELAHTDLAYLKSEFKSHGQTMWEYANGIASDQLQTNSREVKGVGNSVTLSKDATDAETAKAVLLSLAETVSKRLRKGKQIAQTVTVELKYSDFSSFSHQAPFFTPTNVTAVIYESACHLFDELWNGAPIRLIGIRTAKLLPENAPVQLSIFDFATPETSDTTEKQISSDKQNSSPKPSADKLKALDAAIDSIREKYGNQALVRGSIMQSASRKDKSQNK